MASPVVGEASTFLATKRYAVVTGANRGLGLEICKQLACNGVIVVLTARDENKGIEAVKKLKGESSLCNNIVFHQLDVLDQCSVATLAHFVKTQFGRLDILINNAAFGGVTVDKEALKSQTGREGAEINWKEVTYQNYRRNDIVTTKIQLELQLRLRDRVMAKMCLDTNYHGPKRITEAPIPILLLSDSPRIVNVSSVAGHLQNVSNKWAIQLLSNVENLTEDSVELVLNEFMKDFREDVLEAKSWPTYLSAYTISKASINAYTRILAKKYPRFMINCVHPGTMNTNSFTCFLSTEQGAAVPVKIAFLPARGLPDNSSISRKSLNSKT